MFMYVWCSGAGMGGGYVQYCISILAGWLWSTVLRYGGWWFWLWVRLGIGWCGVCGRGAFWVMYFLFFFFFSMVGVLVVGIDAYGN